MSVIEPQAPSEQIAFHRVGAAAPETVVAWRREFGEWLCNRLALDDERRSDVILAVDEALSNAAEFAYSGGGGGEGDVTLDVRYSPTESRLDIEVADNGTWREQDAASRSLARGRGLPLMRALSDHFDLNRESCGTRVRMGFGRCPLPHPPEQRPA